MGNRHGTYDKQYDGDKIMRHVLEKHIPDDAIAYLGITMEDLFSDNLNFNPAVPCTAASVSVVVESNGKSPNDSILSRLYTPPPPTAK